MIRLLTVSDIVTILKRYGIKPYLQDLMQRIKADFTKWHEFDIIARPAFHVEGGVIELMPIADQDWFSYKCVNGHPKNPLSQKQTVVATGQLSKTSDGYPVCISEMTLSTALRTAASSALASDFLSRKNAQSIAMIGTGAQSDFQIIAHTLVRDITTVYYHDIDPDAMERFARNMQDIPDIKFIACNSNEEAVRQSDIVIVCTACKNHVDVIEKDWVKAGTHINGLGGDCPGKTEIAKDLLDHCVIVVEYFEQSFIEGEIQRYSEAEAKARVHSQFDQIIRKEKTARTNDQSITLFDSVGIALEDFSTLNLNYDLAQKLDIGAQVEMIPNLDDPKDLYSLLRS